MERADTEGPLCADCRALLMVRGGERRVFVQEAGALIFARISSRALAVRVLGTSRGLWPDVVFGGPKRPHGELEPPRAAHRRMCETEWPTDWFHREPSADVSPPYGPPNSDHHMPCHESALRRK
jgi:hypothetical protein